MWHTGRNGSKTWMPPLPLWAIGLRHHWVVQHRRRSSWHLWGSHISVLCMYLPIIPLWVISCVSTLWLLLFIFCLVFIVFVTSHFSNVMHKTFGGYVLHGEPIHHVKRLILFYKITFEIFQTFCYLCTSGSMSFSIH